MKKIIKLIPILLLVITFSCGDDDNGRFSTDPTSGWVEFSTTTSSTTISLVTESLSLPVSLRVPVYENGLNVTYSLQAVQGDFTSIVSTDGNTLNFSSLEAPGADGAVNVKNIDLTFSNLDLITEQIVFDVVLTAVDVSGVVIGLDNSITSYRVSTPCPFQYADNYNVDVTGPGGATPSHTVALVPVAGTENQFTISSSWGPNFVAAATGDSSFEGQFPYPTLIIVNQVDFSVEVIGTGNAALEGGTGIYDSCTDQFLITLTQGLFTTDFTVDIVMSGI